MKPDRFDTLTRAFAQTRLSHFTRRRVLQAGAGAWVGLSAAFLHARQQTAMAQPVTALLPPKVVGPLSECNSLVIVRNQLSGALVTLFVGSERVGGGIASWSSERFALDVPLKPGDLVVATQAIGTVTSDPSIPVQVQAAPTDMGSAYVDVDSLIYECGECARVVGAVPGATVRFTEGTTIRGEATAVSGVAWSVGIDPPPDRNDVLEVRQIACGVEGPARALPIDIAPGWANEAFAAPYIPKPLYACMRSVPVAGVIDGAQVTIDRSTQDSRELCFDASELEVGRLLPLVEGEQVTVRQAFARCNITSDTSPAITVSAAEQLPVPVVMAPLCEGANRVGLHNLIPGAVVRLFEGDDLLGDGEAADSFDVFTVRPLSAGSYVSAQQRLCDDLWSEQSASVRVDDTPTVLNPPKFAAPLVACASVVRVESVWPGSIVTIWSRTTGMPRSDEYFVVRDTPDDIPVSPALTAGEEIFAVALICTERLESEVVTVRPLADIEYGSPKVLSLLFDEDTEIFISRIVPGAYVDVSINGVWRYTAVATDLLTSDDELAYVDVPVPEKLRTGDEVVARQRICDVTTDPSSAVIVRPKRPIIITESPLPDGRVGKPYSVQLEVDHGVAPFSWDRSRLPAGIELDRDTGEIAGTPTEAGEFRISLDVTDSGTPAARSDTKHLKLRIKEAAAETEDETYNLYLARQPVYEGHIPYLARFPWADDGSSGTLLGVSLNSAWPGLHFVKPGWTTAECDNPAAVVRLAPGGSLTAAEMTELFGAETPALPIVFLACAEATPTLHVHDYIPIRITYRPN
ncbi:MAG: hypothetical protein AVDCRST_MAG93-1338 [uncultured Chloroflexia bacterium]|uniref:Uncharacterized protein n=1 Tax=uncultured Chloroflexia bacterium TaxID=1672391 RepID=A0A6J4I3G2_9CHLR|nr:MAG: hypothetical protein AVDCRST_MAG93-1338 [uncultured Chloroflexia bacterium]